MTYNFYGLFGPSYSFYGLGGEVAIFKMIFTSLVVLGLHIYSCCLDLPSSGSSCMKILTCLVCHNQVTIMSTQWTYSLLPSCYNHVIVMFTQWTYYWPKSGAFSEKIILRHKKKHFRFYSNLRVLTQKCFSSKTAR